MGKPNVVTKQYMKDNARFADACNFFLFHGEQVIKPEDLTEQEKKEGVRMCKVLDAREKRGMQQGALQVLELVRVLSKNGHPMEEILAMTEDEEDREKLYKQYGIA